MISKNCPKQRHNRLSTAWVQLTQSLYQRLLMWYTGLPVRQSQSSNLFSLVQSKGKRKKGSLAITRESWEEVSDWSKSSPVQFGEVVFSLKIRTQTALWYQTQLIWEVGWVVPNFNKTRWQAVMSLQIVYMNSKGSRLLLEAQNTDCILIPNQIDLRGWVSCTQFQENSLTSGHVFEWLEEGPNYICIKIAHSDSVWSCFLDISVPSAYFAQDLMRGFCG